jgi:hypothetical protein
MADTKISALTDGTAGADGDIVPVARSGANRRLTLLNIANYVITKLTGFLKADGTTTGATSQAQAFTNGVQTQEIKDSSAVSAIAVDARVLRDAAGANNIDFSGIPLFFQGVKTDGIVDASNEYNIISSEGVTVLIGSVDTNAKVVAPNKVLGLGDPDGDGSGNSIVIDNDANEIAINAPDVISLNGTDLPTVTITAADLASPTFELVIEKGFVTSFTP